MAAVSVTRGADGFTLSRTFRSMAAASKALDLLLSVNEAGFIPEPAPTPEEVKLQVHLDRAESDFLPPHDGRLNPPSADEE